MVRGHKDTNTQAACCQSGITSWEESKKSGKGKMPMLKRSTCEHPGKLMKKVRGVVLMRARWVRGRHRVTKGPSQCGLPLRPPQRMVPLEAPGLCWR